MTTTILLGLAVITLIGFVDACFSLRDKRSLQQYFLVGGRLRLPQFVGTILSTNLSMGNFIIFVASWGYFFGAPGIFWFLINLLCNAVAFLLFLPKIKDYVEDRTNSGSLHEYLSHRYAGAGSRDARRLRIVASVATVTGLLFALVFELHLATQIVAPLLGLNRGLVFGAFTCIICLYAAIGGFRSVVATDLVQSGMLVVGTVALLAYIGIEPRHFTDRAEGWFSIGWHNIVGIAVIGSGWFLVAMDNWQRVSATRSVAISKSGFGVYTILIMLFGVAYGYMGLYDAQVVAPMGLAGHTAGANPLSDIFLLPVEGLAASALLGFFALALAMAAMSTADTFLVVAGHSLVSDVIVGATKHTNFSDLSEADNRAFVGLARGIIAGMGVFVILIWVALVQGGLMRDPLSFFFIAYSVQFGLLAPVAFSVLRVRASARAALVSVALGILAALFVGFGSWYLMIAGDAPVLSMAPSKWLSLAPAVTAAFGAMPLIFSILRRRHANAAR